MPAEWTFPTLAVTQGQNGPARCSCGRLTTADMILDLRGLPAQQRGALKLAELACDSCRERAYLHGADRVGVFIALGAPEEIVDIVRARRKG
jgi:hypothetical protein